MEKLETLAVEDFDMEVQAVCDGSCKRDCIEGPNNCSSHFLTQW
ncbi:MAG: hypothetical protein E7L01_08440 [Paenibacillus macerans]|uniref:Lantibiotic n=1 Tax=Paenibacillus macerans TaxID=44252 RepID=A0A090ZHW0_PAEMA|nr:hypothetical protein [Paenibacillus macerans]KFN09988.1 hypothetical protein DJ90_508 [Paenibacillus macerans]MDU7473372.1 hypothetical protein [Paenibacillus macerans]MEC0138085.1 hypothetical protein [Paenibacillus macerans]MEC0153613.1 hypothetical protein [Paenibacillus macerans]SUD26991.1 Uncharacterised protein [Paenibacillus macerans]